MSGPEDNPADEQQPTKESWERVMGDEAKAGTVVEFPEGGARETGGIVGGRWVGQVWRLADGRDGTIVDSGGEGGWHIQPSDGKNPFWVEYHSKHLVELLLPKRSDAAQLDENKKKIAPVVAAAKQVHEAHQRALREHSVSVHHSMDLAWDALAAALKDLG